MGSGFVRGFGPEVKKCVQYNDESSVIKALRDFLGKL
jgi:hypothetical protein